MQNFFGKITWKNNLENMAAREIFCKNEEINEEEFGMSPNNQICAASFQGLVRTNIKSE